jgi:hypothetical protein
MDIAAYYFPNYHADKRNEEYRGPGWTEWELMKCARPRFEGHRQPKIPAWGYEDEADPQVMAKKIDTAAAYGIDAFVFDWYWYDGAFLERALKEGYLNAPNKEKIKFAIMWANHDWHDRHPTGYMNTLDPRKLYLWSSKADSIGFVWDYLIENYFTRPEYWYVDGKPYFSIYSINRFIQQMGGIQETQKVLNLLREKAIKAGLPGIHINAVWFDNLTLQKFCINNGEGYDIAGFDSYTSYNSVGTTKVWQEEFPIVDFKQASDEYIELSKTFFEKLSKPYFPVASVGWDSSPRTIQSEIYRPGGYPFMPVMESNPDELLNLLEALKLQLANVPKQEQIIFINAWNEWTEGAYLEPDTYWGYKLLEKVKEFAKKC